MTRNRSRQTSLTTSIEYSPQPPSRFLVREERHRRRRDGS
jgi:hypothetical protein